jgi:beta-glucosidase-like glycosyl hydrolase
MNNKLIGIQFIGTLTILIGLQSLSAQVSSDAATTQARTPAAKALEGDFAAMGNVPPPVEAEAILNLLASVTTREKIQLLQYSRPNGVPRLGIPNLSYGESLHGIMHSGATAFPQSIDLGGTWDRAQIQLPGSNFGIRSSNGSERTGALVDMQLEWPELRL